MDTWEHLGLIAAAMLATGLIGGVLGGLLGVGGGIVVVPVLDTMLEMLGVDPALRMHIAVATSLATIVPTSIASSRAHRRKGAVDDGLVRKWAVAMFLGAVAGTVLASRLKGGILSAVFAAVAMIVAIKMLPPMNRWSLAPRIPDGPAAQIFPTSIGAISSMMGIGGGTLSVPLLTAFSYPVHRAVGTASLFGLIIAIPGTVGYVISGWGAPGLPPGSLGYVNLIGFALIAPTTWVAAPWGAAIAHRLSRSHLSLAFAAFLLVVSVRMALRVLPH